MSAQSWIQGLTLYFVFIFIIVSLFVGGGLIASSPVTGGYTGQKLTPLNQSSSDESTGLFGGFNLSRYIKAVFSFFAFNIYFTDSTLLQYIIIIRILFVYIPLFFLALAIYYSLPTVSGGQ